MLIAVERLLVRVRQVPSRADELITLRRRLRAARAERATGEERAAAQAVLAAKLEMSRALTEVSSCSTCARGKRPPRGTFPGGDCCSAVTADLFDDAEVAALAQTGTRPGDLTAPRTAHAGCAFRGEQGCTLEATHRPERCVRYLCQILRKELRGRGELDALDAMIARQKTLMEQFTELHRVRLDDEILAPLEALARERSRD